MTDSPVRLKLISLHAITLEAPDKVEAQLGTGARDRALVHVYVDGDE